MVTLPIFVVVAYDICITFSNPYQLHPLPALLSAMPHNLGHTALIGLPLIQNWLFGSLLILINEVNMIWEILLNH